jgi:hypothetical protein
MALAAGGDGRGSAVRGVAPAPVPFDFEAAPFKTVAGAGETSRGQ